MCDIEIHSRDRLTATDSTNSFNVNFSSKPRFSKARLKSVNIPLTEFTINSNNNKIDFRDVTGETNYSVTIPSTSYNPTTLATAIKTALDAEALNPWTVSYSSSTSKLTISNGSNFILLFGSGSNISTSIAKTLGFFKNDTESGTSVISNSVQLNRGPVYHININELYENNISSSGQSYNFSFPVAGNFADILNWENPSKKMYDYKEIKEINIMNVTLMQNDGTLVDINESDWSFTLDTE